MVEMVVIKPVPQMNKQKKVVMMDWVQMLEVVVLVDVMLLYITQLVMF